MKKGEVPKVRSIPDDEEDMYGPFTKLGIMDPNYGTEITFVDGKFRGRSGMYLEKINVQHRVVVYGLPRERTDTVQSVWEHTFKIKGFDGEYYSFEQVETDREVMADNRRREAGLLPLGVAKNAKNRAKPGRVDRLVEEIWQAMDRLGFNGPLSEEVVRKVNLRHT